eukprot:scaffold272844_cov48-Prasinocladus_malaysianus.AAC.1
MAENERLPGCPVQSCIHRRGAPEDVGGSNRNENSSDDLAVRSPTQIAFPHPTIRRALRALTTFHQIA